MSQPTPVDQIRHLLTMVEGSGRIELKRSCLWPLEEESLKVQRVLVRLANANPEVGGLIELGREDDGKRVGLVGKDLAPISPKQLDAAQQKLAQLANRLQPQMQIRWHLVPHQDSLETVVIEVPGRARGHWYQDEQGTAFAGSTSHPFVARPDLLRSWVLEDEEHQLKRRAAALQRQVHTLQEEAQDLLRMGTAILSYPHRFDVTAYRQLLPDIYDLFPVTDPVLERLHELPKLASTINRWLDSSQEERRIEFNFFGPNADPNILCREAVRSQASELERQCGTCEQRLSDVLDSDNRGAGS